MNATLKDCLDVLIERHGTLRAVARAAKLSPGYLSRLRYGEKSHPSDETLAALGVTCSASYGLVDRDDWNCLESQFLGLMEGDGASGDHEDCRNLFRRAGFKPETVELLMGAIVNSRKPVVPL